MIRTLIVASSMMAILMATPAPAAADGTIFLGYAPSPAGRSATGFSLGINFAVVGFELEYSHTAERTEQAAPGLRSGMINAVLQTPTRTQLYLTIGAGLYRERLGEDTETHVGTNIGGGVKMALAGPLRLRLDYRVFNLRGSPRENTAHRMYAGLNLAF